MAKVDSAATTSGNEPTKSNQQTQSGGPNTLREFTPTIIVSVLTSVIVGFLSAAVTLNTSVARQDERIKALESRASAIETREVSGTALENSISGLTAWETTAREKIDLLNRQVSSSVTEIANLKQLEAKVDNLCENTAKASARLDGAERRIERLEIPAPSRAVSSP